MGTTLAPRGAYKPARALVAALAIGATLAIGLLALFARPALATPCQIATITWDGGAGTTSWHDAANWSGDVLPTIGDHVCISGATVGFSGGATAISSLETSGTLTLSGGTLQLDDTGTGSLVATLNQTGGDLGGPATLTITSSANWASGATMSGAGTTHVASGATLSVTGVSAHYLQAGRRLVNDGTVAWSGTGPVYAYAGARIDNNGLWEIAGDHSLADQSGSGLDPEFANDGVLVKSAGTGTASLGVNLDSSGRVEVVSGTLQVEGRLRNFSSTRQQLSGGEFVLGGVLVFDGADVATVAAPVSLTSPGAGFANESGLDGLRNLSRVAPGGTLELADGKLLSATGSFTNNGSVVVDSSSSLSAAEVFTSTGALMVDGSLAAPTINVSSGTLTGAGTVVGDLTNAGVVEPAGTLSISGGYTQTPSGTLALDIVDVSIADQLVVSGAAALDGTLELVTDAGYMPADGDTHTVLASPSLSGLFVHVEGAPLAGGLRWRLETVSAGLAIAARPDSTATWGTVSIDGGADYTNSRAVVLDFTVPSGAVVTGVRVANDSDPTGPFVAYSASMAWTLASGDGVREVRVQFRDDLGNPTTVVADTVFLDTTAPAVAIGDAAGPTDPIVVEFAEEVTGATTANVAIALTGTTSPLPATITCQDATGVVVGCATGWFTRILLQPDAPLAPLVSYTITVNPAAAPTLIADRAANPAPTTTHTTQF